MRLSQRKLLNVLNHQLNVQLDRQEGLPLQEAQRSYNRLMLLLDTISYLENPDFTPDEYLARPELKRVMKPFNSKARERCADEYGEEFDDEFDDNEDKIY